MTSSRQLTGMQSGIEPFKNKFTELIFRAMYMPLAPVWGYKPFSNLGGGREVVRMQQGFHFFLSGTKKLPFFLSLN